MAGFVQGIFLAPEAGAQMKGVRAATALEGCGLQDDRYCAGTGHWSRFGRASCEVTSSPPRTSTTSSGRPAWVCTTASTGATSSPGG